ncbi:MAG: tetratricopeptide repeat protein [Microcystaceae cyanobacterium]
MSSSEPELFNILSLGQRGVGKTVFLAGSYAELNHITPSRQQRKLWFECEREEDTKNLESVLDYVKRTGQYPPPTLKITDFHFILKQRTYRGIRPLCHFRWWDIPGEYCDFAHPDFQKMVLSSHSCCVFINGERLVNDSNYIHELEGLVKQVIAIATLIDQDSINYRFALVFTQCDRLRSGPMSRLQIEENLQFLITSLEAADAKYQRFYSGIPIVSDSSGYHFEVQGSAAAFLWIVSELQKESQSASNSLENALKPDVSSLQYWLSHSPSFIWPLLGMGTAFLGMMAILLITLNPFESTNNYDQLTDQYIERLEKIVQQNPSDAETASTLFDQYLGRGDIAKAIQFLQAMSQQQPENMDWKLKLADLYKVTGEIKKAEMIYDRILVQSPNDFQALWEKALIRNQQGDQASAKTLLQQAEETATTEHDKQKVQETARQLNIDL